VIELIKRAIRKLVFNNPTLSYSQAGEDVVVMHLLNDIGIKQIKYLDIGANKPTFGSNTYLFYSRGNTGVLVEADPSLIPRLKSYRKRDEILNIGVAVSEEKELEFYIFNEPGANTFNKEEALKRDQQGLHKIVDTIKVPLISINELIKNNFKTYPDFMSIDIEGLDLEVLKSLDIAKYPIPIICVETCQYSTNHIRPKDLSIGEFMKSIGYFAYGDTYINTIFVNENWFKSKL
jgi:FkbM family methyltransferase